MEISKNLLNNICDECGLPKIIYSYEIKDKDSDSEKIYIKLICQNYEHKIIDEIEFEEYNNFIKKDNNKKYICKKCNKNINKNSIPFYCYTCKKIICSNCNNSSEKGHNIFKYDDELQNGNKCLIHCNNNNIYFYCLECKKNMCEICMKEDSNHFHNNQIQKINNLKSKMNDKIRDIKKEQEEILKKINIIKQKKFFNEFLINQYHNNVNFLNNVNIFNNSILENSSNNRDEIINNYDNNSSFHKEFFINKDKSQKEIHNKINNNEINIIYHDENFDNESVRVSKECRNIQEKSKGVVILTNNISNLNLLLKYIKKINSKSKFFLVVNGRSAEKTINFIKDNDYSSLFINGFIFTSNKKNKAIIEIKEKNSDLIKEIFDKGDLLVKYIQSCSQNINEDNERFLINSLIDIKLYNIEYYKLSNELYNYYGDESEKVFNDNLLLIKNFIENDKDLIKDLKNDLKNSFEIFSELRNKNYEKIIKYYLKNSRFQNFFNFLLKKKDISIYKKLGYFAGNFIYCLMKFGKPVNMENNFYFGKPMIIIEILEFLKNVNNKITIPFFLSITTKKELVEICSKRNISKEKRKEKDIYSVIITLNYLYSQTKKPCVYEVKDLSENPNEKENILLPFTFLKLNKIEIDSDNYIADIELEIIGKK